MNQWAPELFLDVLDTAYCGELGKNVFVHISHVVVQKGPPVIYEKRTKQQPWDPTEIATIAIYYVIPITSMGEVSLRRRWGRFNAVGGTIEGVFNSLHDKQDCCVHHKINQRDITNKLSFRECIGEPDRVLDRNIGCYWGYRLHDNSPLPRPLGFEPSSLENLGAWKDNTWRETTTVIECWCDHRIHIHDGSRDLSVQCSRCTTTHYWREFTQRSLFEQFRVAREKIAMEAEQMEAINT